MQGVNLIGYFNKAFGIGISGRGMIAALQQSQIPFSLISADYLAEGHQACTYDLPVDNEFRYPINLFCTDFAFLSIVPFFVDKPWKIFKNRHNIAVWFWETNVIPENRQKVFKYFDEFWVTSRYTQEHLSAATGKPVYHIPQPLTVTLQAETSSKESVGLSNKYTFLFSFNCLSGIDRKNPLAVATAFRKAFPNSEQVQLVIKSHNGTKYPDQLKSLFEYIKEDPRIIWLDENMDFQTQNKLMRSCDCYISLHRSEGFGLTMAEAMAFEKPVIATGYSGNLDFMHLDNSFLCDFKLVPVGHGNEFYPPDGIWADVDIDHAASLMRYVFTHPEEARRIAKNGRETIEKYHSYAYVGDKIRKRLNAIQIPEQPKRMPIELFKLQFKKNVRKSILSVIPKPVKNILRKFV